MAYRLKTIKYKNKPRRILVQNENGPCPLIAAANALLLKGAIQLPSNCVGAGVVTIDELINVLAEKVLTNTQQNEQQQASQDHEFAVQEVLQVFPSLQYGMDVNPKFTSGPSGVEYTMQLNAFDLLHVELVHGWLVDPDSTQEYQLIKDQTYNQLVNQVIKGNEAQSELEQIQLGKIALDEDKRRSRQHELSTLATNGSLIHSFLENSANQLTQYGLQVLHDRVKEDELHVFFRNNHFNTLTKHNGALYLLVTDLGFATLPDVVWEKLDMINGDTEYVNYEFGIPPPQQSMVMTQAATGEQLLANNAQSQTDYHLALQLSRESNPPANPTDKSANAAGPPLPPPGERSRSAVEMEAAVQASLLEYQQNKSGWVGDGSTQVSLPAADEDTKVAATKDPSTPNEKDLSLLKPAATSIAKKEQSTPMLAVGVPSSNFAPDDWIARQLHEDEDASRQLAIQLHREEQAKSRTRSHSNPTGSARDKTSEKNGKDDKCAIC